MTKKSQKEKISFKINGKKTSVQAHPMARLLDVIREDLRLTGTKEGCGEGECGACSVMIDGVMVNSCLVPAAQANGAVIKTIEGVASPKKLHEMQSAFLQCGGAQCGICTPGMIMASINLIETKKKERKKITEQDVREGLSGNLCRCTGYTKIFDSVFKGAKR